MWERILLERIPLGERRNCHLRERHIQLKEPRWELLWERHKHHQRERHKHLVHHKHQLGRLLQHNRIHNSHQREHHNHHQRELRNRHQRERRNRHQQERHKRERQELQVQGVGQVQVRGQGQLCKIRCQHVFHVFRNEKILSCHDLDWNAKFQISKRIGCYTYLDSR